MAEKPSTLPDPGADDVLWLIDLSNYVFRAYHALPPLSNSHGEPTNATLGTLNMLNRMIEDNQPSYLGVVMDSPGRGFRGEIDPEYKANRSAAPPDLKRQLQRTREIFEGYGVPIFKQDGYEADDLIATLTKKAVAEGLRVVIASTDKDLMQLVVPGKVWCWDAMRNKVYGEPEVIKKFGVPPTKLLQVLSLIGDTSDNVRRRRDGGAMKRRREEMDLDRVSGGGARMVRVSPSSVSNEPPAPLLPKSSKERVARTMYARRVKESEKWELVWWNGTKVQCEHKKFPSLCRLCGGSGFCEHGRIRSKCKSCGGVSICEHGRRRNQCKPCGGASMCEHGRRRSVCKPCGGSQICEHGRQRNQCKPCGGASICEHGRQRSHCKPCGGSSICEHGRERSKCKPCGGASICEHGRVRSQCEPCGGSQICEHRRRRQDCKECKVCGSGKSKK